MENTRFLKIVIVCLLVINAGVLGYLWFNREPQHPPMRQGPPQGRDVFSYLRKELQMDEQQTRKYEELRDEHHNAVEGFQKHARELREHFFDMLNATDVDSAEVKKVADSIAATQQQIEMVTFYHFKKVRTILRPEQQKRFDEVIQDALRMMSPGGPPPPPQK